MKQISEQQYEQMQIDRRIVEAIETLTAAGFKPVISLGAPGGQYGVKLKPEWETWFTAISIVEAMEKAVTEMERR